MEHGTKIGKKFSNLLTLLFGSKKIKSFSHTPSIAMNIYSMLQRSAIQLLKGPSYATGFIFRFDGFNFIATNAHFVRDSDSCHRLEKRSDIECILCGFVTGTKEDVKKNNPYPFSKRISYAPKDMFWHYSSDFDLCVGLLPQSFDFTAPNCDILIFPYLSYWRDTGSFGIELEVGNEVCLFGFPRAMFKNDGIPLSFMRKGIIARVFNSSHDYDKFRNRIIIDAMTMAGMSGSPVFQIASPMTEHHNSQTKSSSHLMEQNKAFPQLFHRLCGMDVRFLGLINQSLYDEAFYNNSNIIINDNFSIVQPAFEIGNLASNMIDLMKKGEINDYKPSIGFGFRNSAVEL